MTERLLIEALDALAADGNKVEFWLRDDDCTQPGEALDLFFSASARHGIPVTLAVIPASTDERLAKRLASEENVGIAVHGWSHANHAPDGVKKRELGADRPVEIVAEELRRGLKTLSVLHGERFIPMLVPPWNRIAPNVVARLPELGFSSLSTFGPEKAAAVPMLNTHVDVIDWHGTRGGRDPDTLFSELATLSRSAGVIGVLTHHLVHDTVVTGFLDRLFSLTAGHPGCCWSSATDILARGLPALPGNQKA